VADYAAHNWQMSGSAPQGRRLIVGLLLVGGVWTIMSQSWLLILVLSSARGFYIFKMPSQCPMRWYIPTTWRPLTTQLFVFLLLLLWGELWHFLWPVLMFWPSNLMMLNGVAVDCRNMRAGSFGVGGVRELLECSKWQQIQFVGWAFETVQVADEERSCSWTST